MATNKRKMGTKVGYGTDLNNSKWFGSDEAAMDAANQDLQNADEGRPRLTFIPVPVTVSPAASQVDETGIPNNPPPVPSFLRPPSSAQGNVDEGSHLPPTNAPHLPPNVTNTADKLNLPRFLRQAVENLGPVQDSVPDVAAPEMQGGYQRPNFLGGATPKGNVFDPSLQEAASIGAVPGGENVLSPALTKGSKLMLLLKKGLEGAAAGWGAPTGGEGFLRATKLEQQQNQQRLNAQQLPFLRQKQQADLEQTQASTAQAKAHTAFYNQQLNKPRLVKVGKGLLAIGSDGKSLGLVAGSERQLDLKTTAGREDAINQYNDDNPDNPLTTEQEQQIRFNGRIGKNTPFDAWLNADDQTPEGQQAIERVQSYQAMTHPDRRRAPAGSTAATRRDNEKNQFSGDVGGLTESIYGKHTVNGKPDYDAMLSEAHNLQPKTARAERIRQGAIDKINKLRSGEIRPKKRLEDATAQTVMDSLSEDNGQQ